MQIYLIRKGKEMKRIEQLEKLRENISRLRYREVVEGCENDKCGEKLENKILDLVTDARVIGEKP
jgi:hypothetical protein